MTFRLEVRVLPSLAPSLHGSASEAVLDPDERDLVPGASPVESALVTLTSIVNELARRKPDKERTWDNVLDGLEGLPSTEGSSSSTSGSRSKTAALSEP